MEAHRGYPVALIERNNVGKISFIFPVECLYDFIYKLIYLFLGHLIYWFRHLDKYRVVSYRFSWLPVHALKVLLTADTPRVKCLMTLLSTTT